MKWYEFRTDSITALAEFVLSLVILIYLITLKNKSKDGRIIKGYVWITAGFFFVSFIKNINELSWSQVIDIVLEIYALILGTYHMWFSYAYKEMAFRKEMRIVMSVLIFTVVFVVGIQTASFISSHNFMHITPLLFQFLILIYLWSIVVFIRKSILYTKTKNQQFPGVNHEQARINKNSSAYKAFAVWSGLFLIVYLMWTLVFLGIANFLAVLICSHILNLISLVWFAITYMNYADEYTTFQAKLVGLILCTILLLLGSIGFFILPLSFIVNPVIRETVTHSINILMLLVPVMTALIVLIFPIFFNKNLLYPLRQILAGVQQVNAGNLNVEIPATVNDEMGFLSQNFNQMSQALRAYAQDMESKVAQRTIELKRKSDELEIQKEELQITLKDLKSTQAQLIQQEKMASLGELTAGIAHEIQNPLNFVNNFSEVNKEMIDELQTELKSGNTEEAITISNDIKENEEKINHHGKRADAIVKGMLQHSKQTKGIKEPTDINTLCDEYLRLSYHGLRAKDKNFNADCKTDFDESIGKINVIPQDIGRVLLNLFNNAFYAVNEQKKRNLNGYQPTVSVSTKKVENHAIFTVSDNGNGISQKVLDKIFQPFFTTKPTGEGTGLGLSLSYDIVKAHGGEIKVESKEGEGSEFIIQLPIN